MGKRKNNVKGNYLKKNNFFSFFFLLYFFISINGCVSKSHVSNDLRDFLIYCEKQQDKECLEVVLSKYVDVLEKTKDKIYDDF